MARAPERARCGPVCHSPGLAGLPAQRTGGHLTHGYQRTMKDGSVKAISASSYYFKSSSYAVNQTTGLLDMALIAEQVQEFKPDLCVHPFPSPAPTRARSPPSRRFVCLADPGYRCDAH